LSKFKTSGEDDDDDEEEDWWLLDQVATPSHLVKSAEEFSAFLDHMRKNRIWL
jgi:hypothetical protein